VRSYDEMNSKLQNHFSGNDDKITIQLV